MASWSRLNGGSVTGHWMTPNAGYAVGSTVPPINYRTNVRTRCQPVTNTWPGSVPGPMAFDQETAFHSWDNWNLSIGFKSKHPGGAQFLYIPLYQWLGCRNDGQIIPGGAVK